MEVASNEDILVMKRMTSLSAYPELKKEILKIPVTATNPLTRDLIWKKVVEFTRIQAELKTTEHTANLVKGPTRSSRCLSCNATKSDSLKLCSHCFKNGPRKGTYCPKCKSTDNHTQEACSGQNFKWPQASPWMKAQNRNRTPSKSPNRNSGRNSPRSQRGRSPQKRPPQEAVKAPKPGSAIGPQPLLITPTTQNLRNLQTPGTPTLQSALTMKPKYATSSG